MKDIDTRIKKNIIEKKKNPAKINKTNTEI